MFLNYQFNIPDTIQHQMMRELNSGRQLFHILKLLNFKQAIIMRIKFGELYGEFNEVLHEVIIYCQLKQRQWRQILQALTYPIILMVVLFAMILFFNQLIIPQFANFYSQDQIEMNTVITMLMYILATIPKVILFLIAIIAINIILLCIVYHYKTIHYFCTIMYKLPIINYIFKHYMTFIFTRELSYFLRNGFSLNQTLSIFTQINNKYIQYIAQYLIKDIEEGHSLSHVIKKQNLFVNDLSGFIEHGEMNGILSEELRLFSELCLERMINKVNRYLKIIQPILFTVLALIIVGLYCIIMMPMFDLLNHFGEGE